MRSNVGSNFLPIDLSEFFIGDLNFFASSLLKTEKIMKIKFLKFWEVRRRWKWNLSLTLVDPHLINIAHVISMGKFIDSHESMPCESVFGSSTLRSRSHLKHFFFHRLLWVDPGLAMLFSIDSHESIPAQRVKQEDDIEQCEFPWDSAGRCDVCHGRSAFYTQLSGWQVQWAFH